MFYFSTAKSLKAKEKHLEAYQAEVWKKKIQYLDGKLDEQRKDIAEKVEGLNRTLDKLVKDLDLSLKDVSLN